MNPNAREFVFNVTAKEFKPPGSGPAPPAPPSQQQGCFIKIKIY